MEDWKEVKMNSCPIFRGTGKKAKPERECNTCPFRDDCLQDIFDDAVAKIMELLGKFIDKKREKK